ncbi:MAG: OmpH family outer membrane protein [Gammaproteobacteria bacterium]
MIRKYTVLTMAVWTMLLSAWAGAQDVKIGFVNIGRLISESPQATSAMEALQEEFAPRQREIIALQNAFKEKQSQIQRDLEVMGPEERRNSEQQLRKEERDLSRTQQEFTEDINLRRNESLGKLQRELLREVQVFATNEGFDLVVSSDGVLYASPVIDVTEQVLEGLKASYATQPATN